MKSLTLILSLVTFFAFAQKELKPTASFSITGEVKAPATVLLADLKKWKEVNVGDIVITNHLGEKKSEAKALKGVLLRDVLQSVEINAESPKVLSEYFFVCKATDGYTIVYSWNEIFNTSTGDTSFVITGKDGKPASELKDAIQLYSARDFKTGRRSLYGLASIDVRRAR